MLHTLMDIKTKLFVNKSRKFRVTFKIAHSLHYLNSTVKNVLPGFILYLIGCSVNVMSNSKAKDK